MWKLFRWFDLWWWEYLFAPRHTYYDDIPYWEVLLCRLRGHPNGSIYYNPYGYEPNDHCKDCGDLI